MCCFFFFNDTATTEIYTLSLHDALPICFELFPARRCGSRVTAAAGRPRAAPDRKSTRLNSSHTVISYAVFCLKKKKNKARELVTQLADLMRATLKDSVGIGSRSDGHTNV